MPKQIPPLTSAQVMNAKPVPGRRLELRDGMVPGLHLRVLSDGERSWSLLVQAPGKRAKERLDVGRGLSLSEARTRAAEMRAQLRRGEAPAQPLREAREAARAAKTFREVLDDYGAAEGGQNKTWRDQRNRISHVFAALLDRPGLSLSEADFLLATDKHPSRSSAAAAIRYVRPLIKWAGKRRLMDKTIVSELETTQSGKRKRVLSNEELARVLGALGDGDQDRCARFLLWTLARREEAVRATWEHVDLAAATWTIPAGHRKNTRRQDLPDLVIPLPRQAIAILRKMRPASPTGLLFRSARSGPLDNWNRWQKRIFATSQTSGWHRHDLRRTGATLAGEIGIPPHVVEVMLGHAQPHSQLAGVYNHSRYAAEHREAVQRLADAYEHIESGQTAVLAFRRLPKRLQ